MASATPEPVALAILAKAPVAGLVKTRLIPALGADGAAALHARLIERTVETACAAAIGPVTLWVTPGPHPCFTALASRFQIALAAQPDGDLGARMLAACQAAAEICRQAGAPPGRQDRRSAATPSRTRKNRIA